MDCAEKSPQEVLEDVTAFALSSGSLLDRARALAIGSSFAFVPSQVRDGSPIQQRNASRWSWPFTIARISLADLPREFGVAESDLLPGSLAFLISSQADPHSHQLALLDPPERSHT